MTTRQWLWGLVMAVAAAALSYILSTDAPAAITAGVTTGGAWVGGAKAMLRGI